MNWLRIFRSRFPDSGIVGSFSILDPQNLPSPADPASYGSIEIDTLSLHYGESKETSNGMKLEPVVNGEELKEELVQFKQMMSKSFTNFSIQGIAKNCSVF